LLGLDGNWEKRWERSVPDCMVCAGYKARTPTASADRDSPVPELHATSGEAPLYENFNQPRHSGGLHRLPRTCRSFREVWSVRVWDGWICLGNWRARCSPVQPAGVRRLVPKGRSGFVWSSLQVEVSGPRARQRVRPDSLARVAAGQPPKRRKICCCWARASPEPLPPRPLVDWT
jgi:hypothetical protein